jgi:hypothetical protein
MLSPHRLLIAFLAFLLLGAASLQPAFAEDLVVVVHPDSRLEHLSRTEVINIFLGRYKKLPTGQSATPIDTLALKEQFYSLLVGKPLAEINAYWARLVFSGATSPPIQSSSEQAALAQLYDQPGGITYVSRGKVGKNARIVFTLESP